MVEVYIALGGNVGDVRAAFMAARRRLHARVGEIAASSRLYLTEPLLPPDAHDGSGARVSPYLNAVCRLHTWVEPQALLRALWCSEREAGRRRTGRWAPRELDLDLLAYGALRIQTPTLTVPHPAYAQRAFVLAPFCDVGACVRLPPHGLTPRALWARLPAESRGVLRLWNRW